jgi:catechol 2,3-dioxygenase-like lactoylglutathione lyase family enzyme
VATANRWSMSDRRKFTAVGLAAVGSFVLCCGAGMTNFAVLGLGVALLALGPGFIFMSGVRDNTREYVYGNAHVHSASPPPAAGTTGRCELHLLINAKGIDGVAVRVRDPAVPVSKWPDQGATLPILVAAGDPRRVKVLWDEVRTHGEIADEGDLFPEYEYAEETVAPEGSYVETGPPPVDGTLPGEPIDGTLSEEPVDGEPLDEGRLPEERLPEEPAMASRPAGFVVSASGPPVHVDQVVDTRRPEPPSGVPVEPAPLRRRLPSPRRRRSPLRQRTPGDESAAFVGLPAVATDTGAPLVNDPFAVAEPGADDPYADQPLTKPPASDRAAGQPLTSPPADDSGHERASAEPATPPADPAPGSSGSPATGSDPAGTAAGDTPIYAATLNAGSADRTSAAAAGGPSIADLPPDGDLTGPAAGLGLPGPARPEPPVRRYGVPSLLGSVSGVSVTLIVSDLARSLTFYRDTLGLTEIDSGTGSAVLASGDSRITLRRVADMSPVDRRVTHVNLEVNDVQEAYERLRARGVQFVHKPRVVSQGEQLEQWAATFRDPDGHAIALTRWQIRR